MSSYVEGGTSRAASEEDRKVATMRALVEARDPSAKEASNETIRRFLRARNLEVEKGSAMFLKYLQWRREFVPNGSFSKEDVVGKGVASNVLYMQGFDKIGRPILVVLAANHMPVPDIDHFKRLSLSLSLVYIYIYASSSSSSFSLTGYAVYAIDKICSRIPSGQEKFVVIIDMKGYGYASNDVRAFIAGLSLLQDYYPERLAKLFFVHVPHIFMAAWKIISPFVDKNTKKKIAFVESKKMKAAMLQDINESQLPEPYGGKLKLLSVEQD